LFKSIFPYYMKRNEANTSTLDIHQAKPLLLCAPNGHGKTTLLRCMVSCTILVKCGLFAPCDDVQLPPLVSVFVRLPETDRPGVGLSGLSAEVSDLSPILQSLTEQSFIQVDEMFNGCDPREGTALAYALITHMVNMRSFGVFSSHNHSLVNAIRSIGVVCTVNKHHEFSIGASVTTNALQTASQYGIPGEMIRTAQKFLAVNPTIELNIPCDTHTPSHTQRQSTLLEYDFKHNTHNVPLILTRAFDIAKKLKSPYPAYYTIPANKLPPPHICGFQLSYVYIIQENIDPDVYYVGETDDLLTRITTHRKKKNRMGTAYCFRVRDKTVSRMFESQLIRSCRASNIVLSSYADGHHV
jgi:hypothetical protein